MKNIIINLIALLFLIISIQDFSKGILFGGIFDLLIAVILSSPTNHIINRSPSPKVVKLIICLGIVVSLFLYTANKV